MSDNMLTTLHFEGKSIRMVGTSDRPEWVAADVCEVLGISNARQAVAAFPVNSKGVSSIDTLGGHQEMLTVTEPGLYRLIFKSRKVEAEQFRAFVCEEVLPCIRRHGCYPAPDVVVNGNALVSIDVNSPAIERLASLVSGGLLQINSSVADLHQMATNTKSELCEVRNEVQELKQVFNDWAPRKALSTHTQKLHIRIVYNYYGGKCPCCRKVMIVDENKGRLERLEFDHWVRRTQNGPQETWAVCDQCNSQFKDHDFKSSNQVLFAAYQKFRESLQRAIAGPCLPGMEDAR